MWFDWLSILRLLLIEGEVYREERGPLLEPCADQYM